MAEKKVTGFRKAADSGWRREPGSSGRPCAGCPGRQHHAVLPGVQRPDADQSGTIIPVEITVYEDKSFTFVCKTPPAAVPDQGEARHQERLGHSAAQAVGTLTEDQLREIAEVKMPDLNANTIEAAMEIIAGTARSMGVRIEGREMKKKYVPSKKVAAMLPGQRRSAKARPGWPRVALTYKWKSACARYEPRKELRHDQDVQELPRRRGEGRRDAVRPARGVRAR